MPRLYQIDALEPRRMLAVFDGTSGADSITTSISGGVAHININGNDQTTADTTIAINALGGNDTVNINDVPIGLTVNLGDGNDLVRYGNNDAVVGLPESANIAGGSGSDRVTFNDRSSNRTEHYLVTPSSLYQQVFSSIEDAELTVRAAGNFAFVDIVGTAGLNFLTIHGGTSIDDGLSVDVGSPFGPPVDVDSLNFSVDFDCFRTIFDVYDQDANQSNNPYTLWHAGGAQRVSKGPFVASFGQASSVMLHTGTTNDMIRVAGIDSFLFAIDDAGGSNLLETINFGGLAFDNDLDAVFPETVTVTGSGDDWLLDLNDSADQTGDGDADYLLTGGITGAAALHKGGRDIIHYPNDASINLVADADNNTFTIGSSTLDGGFLTRATLNGGAGNDTFTNFNGSGLQTIFGGGAIIGGPGIDRFEIGNNESAQFNHVQNYRFDSSGFSWDSDLTVEGPVTFGLDATLEVMTLDQNAGSTPTFLDFKHANTSLTINAGDGNDTFTVGGGDIDSNGWGLTTLVGGAGTDPIRFDDHLDTGAAGETESYIFDTFSLAKGVVGLSYSSFESQVLDAADVLNSGFSTVPTINLNTLSGQIEDTTINGGPNRGSTVNVGSGNLTTIAGTLTLVNCTTINFNDQSATVARSYQVSATEMTSPKSVTFSGATALTVNGGPLNDNFIIRGSAPGTAAVFNSNGGNDFITVGDGFGSNYASPVSVNGNTGTDFVRFSSASGTGFFSGTLRNASFASNGLSHSYASFENVIVQSGDDGSDITIQSVPQLTPPALSMTEFAGGSGDDLVTISTGSLGSIRGNVAVTGGGGDDTMVLNDSSGSGGTYTFDQGDRFFKGTSVGITITRERGVEQEVLQSSSGNDTINVQDANEPLTILSNGGNDTVTVLDASDSVTVNTGPENTGATTAPFGDSIDVRDGITVIEQDDAVLGLSVAQGTTLRVAGGAVLSKSSGTGSVLSLTGTIDLAGGSFLSRAGGPSLSTFQTFVTRGFNLGSWNGTNASGAINSSLAAGSTLGDGVGLGMGSQIGVTGIGPFAISATDALLRYTLTGDSNLDAVVDVADLGTLASNWKGNGKAYTQGDSNFDAVVDVADLGALASNWQQSVAAPSAVSLQLSRRPKHESTATRLIELT